MSVVAVTLPACEACVASLCSVSEPVPELVRGLAGSEDREEAEVCSDSRTAPMGFLVLGFPFVACLMLAGVMSFEE